MDRLGEILRRVTSTPDGTPASAEDAGTILAAIDKHPYFAAAATVLLRHWPEGWDESQLADIRHKLALAAPDRRTLLTAKYGDRWTDFYPEIESAPMPETEDVIDTFLRTYGSCSPEEEAQLERLIFNPTPDYAELLARQEQEELPDETDDGAPGSQDALINAFIRSQHPKTATQEEELPEEDIEETDTSPVNRPDHTDDSLLSESLAKIFIKQGRYERAYEIISGLNLKFPKKSAYFADQLRFLQKLIINQRRLAEQNNAHDGDRN